MKKEFLLVVTAALFILAYVIDYISGPVAIVIKSPVMFFNTAMMAKFPLTTVGVMARGTGIVLAVVLIWSLFSRMYMVKVGVTFFLAVLCELFAVQQIATGVRTVTIQWTLALTLAGVGLVLPILVYFILNFIPRPTVTINKPNENSDQEASV